MLEESELSKISATAYFSLYFKFTGKNIADWNKKNLIKGKTTFNKSYLFKDPYMEIIIQHIPEKILEQIKPIEKFQDNLSPILGPVHAVRHRYFNKTLKRAVKENTILAKQIIFLGAGFDDRPIRKNQYPVTFYEVDTKEILAAKEKVMNHPDILAEKNKNPQNAKIVSIGMNYTQEDLLKNLIANGLDINSPTHVIWEGNILYLPIEKVKEIIKIFKENFKAPVTISFDYHDQTTIQKTTGIPALTGLISAIEKKVGKPSLTGIGSIEEFAKELGVSIVDNRNMSTLINDYGIDDEKNSVLEHYYCCTIAINPAQKLEKSEILEDQEQIQNSI